MRMTRSGNGKRTALMRNRSMSGNCSNGGSSQERKRKRKRTTRMMLKLMVMARILRTIAAASPRTSLTHYLDRWDIGTDTLLVKGMLARTRRLMTTGNAVTKFVVHLPKKECG